MNQFCEQLSSAFQLPCGNAFGLTVLFVLAFFGVGLCWWFVLTNDYERDRR
jgi:hypothetical protein